ncbi:hypothetical protein C8A00DRAFT_19531 [Chaetomidium leptoderma]|uniref:Heterokaryon incompatibility domain-containing protein n=1 Tax=Chaetomidium leptoderma TaxID=669021 RepID=A0AAN6VCB5_9PEZI|nr:hypothetical protein C8A00DRAFT_19531 [Chaetomidium leptoderma]
MDAPSLEPGPTAAEATRRFYATIPLNLADKQIRVLKILPAQDRSELVMDMLVLSFDHLPHVNALVDACGVSEHARSMEVDNGDVLLSKTLSNALYQIRRRFCATAPIILWNDAISIHQNDRAEWRTQVALEPRIYAGAERVLLWFGILNSRERGAMVAIRSLAIEKTALGEKDGSFSSTVGHPRSAEAVVERLFRGLASLQTRPWFRAPWMLQHVSSPAAVPLVLFNNDMLCWDCFCLGFRHLYRRFQHRFDPAMARASPAIRRWTNRGLDSELDFVNRSRQRRQAARPGMDVFLEEVLWMASRAEPTDPMDKVYGFLATIVQGAQNKMAVDYKLSLPQTYTDVVLYIFEAAGGLGILSCAGVGEGVPQGPGMCPSWLPRFDHLLGNSRLIRPRDERGAIYKASCDLYAKPQPLSRCRLSIYGITVDKVTVVDPVLAPGKQNSSAASELRAQAAVFARAAKPCGMCGCDSAMAQGQQEHTRPEPFAVFKHCFRPMYKPRMPAEPPQRTQSTTDRPRSRVSRHHYHTSPGVPSSSQTVPPPPRPHDPAIWWPYNVCKPFHHVFWRAFIGDCLFHNEDEHDDDDDDDDDGSTAAAAPPYTAPAPERPGWDLVTSVLQRATEEAQQQQQQQGQVGGEEPEPERERYLEKLLFPGGDPPRVSEARCAFVTAGGWLGFGPPGMRAGDVVVVLIGADVPFVVRPLENKKEDEEEDYVMVGEAYVDGLMFGELFEHCPTVDGRSGGRPMVILRERFCFC